MTGWGYVDQVIGNNQEGHSDQQWTDEGDDQMKGMTSSAQVWPGDGDDQIGPGEELWPGKDLWPGEGE